MFVSRKTRGLALMTAMLALATAAWQSPPRADAAGLTALAERRTKILAERKALVENITKDGRVFTAEEKEKVNALKKEYDDIDVSIRESEDVDKALKASVKAAAGRGDSVGDDCENDFSEADIENYSLMKAMRAMADKKPVEGLEAEMSRHMMKKFGGKAPRGVYVPSRVIVARLMPRPRGAAIDTSTGSGGLSTVTSSDYIDALRNLSLIGRLGVTVINGLQGKFAIPRAAGNTSYWPGEGTAPTAGANTLDQVLFSDKTIGAYQDVTRTFMNQTSLSVEQFLTDQLVRSIAAGVGTAMLNGTGGTNTPLGILNNTAVQYMSLLGNSTSGTGALPVNLTGSALTWAGAVKMETLVANGNVIIDSGAYVLSSGGMGQAKTVAKASNAPMFIAEDGEINGYGAYASNGLPNTNGTNSNSSNAIFGNWRDAVIGLWSGIDITVDPYALSTTGGLRIIGLQSVDFQVRHPESFSKLIGIAV